MLRLQRRQADSIALRRYNCNPLNSLTTFRNTYLSLAYQEALQPKATKMRINVNKLSNSRGFRHYQTLSNLTAQDLPKSKKFI